MDNSNDFDKLRPKIEVFVSNSGTRTFFKRKYYCKLCDSDVAYASYKQYDKHQVIIIIYIF